MRLQDGTLARTRPPLARVLLFAMLCLADAVHANRHSPLDPQAVADLSLDELLAVPVSVASLRAESFAEAPSSVTVFTRREILDMGVRTIEDLLNYVPGFRSVRTASRSAYAVGARGRNSAQSSNDILFMIDGWRLNDDFSGAALLFNRYLSTGNVRQVEVIRGPGSALYGSNAFVGIVNIVTAQDLNEAFVAGSDGSVGGYLAVSGGDADYHASLFAAAMDDSGQTFADPTAPGSTIEDPRRGFSAYGTLQTQRWRVGARHARFRVDDFYVYRVVPGNDVNEYEAEDSALSLEYTVLKHATQQLKLTGGWRRIDNVGLGELFDASEMQALGWGTEAYLGGSVARLTEWRMGLDGSTRLDQRHQLFAGLSYRHTTFDKLRNRNNYETLDLINGDLPPRYYGEVVDSAEIGPEGDSRWIVGAYLQDRVVLSDRLKATLGLRADFYSDVDTALNPRAALVYKAAPRSTVKAMYGEAFRAPTVLELDLKNTPRTEGNPDLDPEKIRTLELAWLQEFDRAHLTVTGYASRLEDQILRVVGAGGVLTFANGDSEDLSGIEFELGADLGRNLSLRATYAHAFELIADPQTMPKDTASLIVNHRAGALNTNLNLTWRSSVETGTQVSERLDAAWDVNLNLRYRLGRATLVGGVYNLTDEDTGDYTQTEIPGGTPRRERSFRLGVEFPF